MTKRRKTAPLAREEPKQKRSLKKRRRKRKRLPKSRNPNATCV